jgi:AAA+ superfamily predicted ATPase
MNYCQDELNAPAVQWMVLAGGGYQVCGRTVGRLPAGAYSCVVDCYGNRRFYERRLQVDDLVDFPDSLPSQVLREIAHFWALRERFRRYGFLHRRGYLFYGKQGGGKSSLIHQVVARILAQGHLAFFCDDPCDFVACLEQFRRVEPDRPIVCVFEDIDAIIKRYGDSLLLSWLDGNHQVDQAVNLASTNYPERLDRRIVSRPRRFDRILRIDSPDARLRDAYFARKVPDQPPAERARWVELTEGLPFAALAELVISVKCLGNDVEESASLLRQLDKHTPSSSEFGDGQQANGVAEQPAEEPTA